MRVFVWLASATAGLLVIVAAVMLLRGSPPERKAQPPATTAAANVPQATPSPAAAAPPSFDIVTVDRNGQAVIAGRAMPGDRVTVLDGDKTVGKVTADRRGEWALVPQTPIAPGNHELSLTATAPDSTAPRRSKDVVALAIAPPAGAGAADTAVAVLLPGEAGRPVRVLQQPASAAGQALSLGTVEYGDDKRLVLSGHADPGARVEVYAGVQLLGTATADTAGKWSLAASHPPITGKVELRLAELAGNGAVAQRVAAPLAAPEPAAGGTYVVTRGNSLWLIARHAYGNGTRYTTIYHANRGRIRDPDLIYPGQQFKLPRS